MIRMKKQDMPVVGALVLQSFVRFKSDFVAFSDMFDGGFEDEMRDAIEAVRNRRRPIDVFDKQRRLTFELYGKMDEMKEALRLLGSYLVLAKGNLKTLVGHYGIKEAREAAHARSVKAMLEECEQVVDKLEVDDSAALAAVGFDAGKLADFKALVEEIRALYVARNMKASERREVRATEVALFDALWEYVSKVILVGKAMYTYREKHRYKAFSVSHILRRLNHGLTLKKKGKAEQVDKMSVSDSKSEEKKYAKAEAKTVAPIMKRSMIVGRVVNSVSDEGVADVVVRLGDSERMVETNAAGEFCMEGVGAGEYWLWFGKTGYVDAERKEIVVGDGGVCFVDDVVMRPSLGVVV